MVRSVIKQGSCSCRLCGRRPGFVLLLAGHVFGPEAAEGWEMQLIGSFCQRCSDRLLRGKAPKRQLVRLLAEVCGVDT